MKNPRDRTAATLIAMACLALAPGTPVSGQTAAAKSDSSSSLPDMNGVWQAPYTPNLAKPLGHELPMNPEGAARFKVNRDSQEANDPSSYCLPVGPARGIQAPMPFQIVQTRDTVAVLFEYQRTFRLIYTDGRGHPENWDPEWFGNSTGKWDGDTLVVDTIDMNDRTWLDTAGHEHSDQLHLTERFRKTDPNTIQWTVTFQDPQLYTQPFTVTLPLKRQDTIIMSYSCEENERDRKGSHIPPVSR
jgi:hypothetical protein